MGNPEAVRGLIEQAQSLEAANLIIERHLDSANVEQKLSFLLGLFDDVRITHSTDDENATEEQRLLSDYNAVLTCIVETSIFANI